MGGVEFFQGGSIKTSEPRVRMEETPVLLKPANTLFERLDLDLVVDIIRGNEDGGGRNARWGIVPQKTFQKKKLYHGANRCKQRHPFRVSVNTGILNGAKVAADLTEGPVPVSNIANRLQLSRFFDRTIKILKTQFASFTAGVFHQLRPSRSAR